MYELTYTRLIWQIPVLILISALFMPNVPWYSSTFGFWPIWILSLPFAAMIQHRLGDRNSLIYEQSVKHSQVLVFNNKREVQRTTKQGLRQAA